MANTGGAKLVANSFQEGDPLQLREGSKTGMGLTNSSHFNTTGMGF